MSETNTTPAEDQDSAGKPYTPDIVEVPSDHLSELGGNDPPLTVMGMAENPLELMMAEHLKYFHKEFDRNRRLSDRAPDHLEAIYQDRAMKLSHHFVRLYEAFMKFRKREAQRMIVEHRTVSVPSGRIRREPGLAPRAKAAHPGQVRTGKIGNAP